MPTKACLLHWLQLKIGKNTKTSYLRTLKSKNQQGDRWEKLKLEQSVLWSFLGFFFSSAICLWTKSSSSCRTDQGWWTAPEPLFLARRWRKRTHVSWIVWGQPKGKGYEGAEVYIHNNITRVIYGNFKTQADAYDTLRKIHREKGLEEAWVYQFKDPHTSNWQKTCLCLEEMRKGAPMLLSMERESLSFFSSLFSLLYPEGEICHMEL